MPENNMMAFINWMSFIEAALKEMFNYFRINIFVEPPIKKSKI